MIRATIKPGSRADKGYYFARPDDGGTDVFVHWSVIEDGGELAIGDQVDLSYEAQADGRLRATFVQRVSERRLA